MGRKRASSRLTAVVAGILVCVAAVSTPRAGVEAGAGGITAERITFPGQRIELSGVIYKPRGFDDAGRIRPPREYAAVVMMHGCSGIWSERVVGKTNRDGTPNLQNNVEKWGIKLAESNVVALAVDSFTPRMPGDVTTSEEWQHQCSDNAGRYAGAVCPYTERVHDARAAWEFLNALPAIDGARIGLLGWSHGAQAVMVEAAETERFTNVPRPELDHKFVCSVAFYPGCGVSLGFGAESQLVTTSFWRPFRPLQLHMGMCDPFYTNCLARTNLVTSQSAQRREVPLYVSAYPGARHHFDAFSQTWPTTSSRKTNPKAADDDHDAGLSADESAMITADVAALQFFLSALA